MEKTSALVMTILENQQLNQLLQKVLIHKGYQVVTCTDLSTARSALKSTPPDLVLFGEKFSDGDGLHYADVLLKELPAANLILLTSKNDPSYQNIFLRKGVSECVSLPVRTEEFIQAVQHCLEHSSRRRDWLLREARRATTSLQRRVDELEALTRLGRSIISSLDLESVFSMVVDAAVSLTDAEEGSLMLLDESTNQMTMRASRNFKEEFAQKFNLPVEDSLISTVIETRQPLLINEDSPRQIKTAYLVYSLIIVPLFNKDKVIGILGVDNTTQGKPFRERDLKLLMALAEFVVVAIENARLYTEAYNERNRLNNMVSNVQDGVILFDEDLHLVLVNRSAQSDFHLVETTWQNRSFPDVFTQPELVNLVYSSQENRINKWVEVSLPGDRVLNAQITAIPGLGFAITTHDISYLKKLDRMKSDFVNAVSHDLRSPLTAIMGYVDLLERAGEINDTQRDFIRRVQLSVQNITTLVDNLLNLGRIEAGLDIRRENVEINALASSSVDNFHKAWGSKKQEVVLELSDANPVVYANPVQMHQVIDNLLENAIKYTPEEGKITITTTVEQNQIILKVCDTGIGIPTRDLPFVFEKFFRASNVETSLMGTGLGLSIVRSSVEANGGRIWADSTPGQGSLFTVVFSQSEP